MDELAVRNKPFDAARRLTDARMAILERKWGSGEIAFNHQVLAQLALPYRRVDPMRSFERSSGRASIRIDAGAVAGRNGDFVEVGVPYGAKSRLILILLSSLAVKEQSRTIEIDHSFRAFCKSCGVTLSGNNNRQMKEQLLRLSAVSMRLAVTNNTTASVFQGHIFSHFSIQLPTDERQQFLWNTEVSFTREFYESLNTNAVPLEKDAILALKHSARALDIYMWLASTLFRRKKRTTIRWTSLRFQFGNRKQDMTGFKRAFKTALKQALLVYPEAKVKVITGGIAIEPSLPPVPTQSQRNLLL